MTIRKGPILSKKDYDLAISMGSGGLSIATATAPYLKPALGVARTVATGLIRKWIRAGFKRFKTVRPGGGSKVTSGPLRVGKSVVYGRTQPGIGRVLGAASAVGGIGVVASHRSTMRPATQTRPMPQRTSPKPKTKTETKKCCPIGTKRMVCFKRGRVKPRKAKPRKVRVKKYLPKTRKAKSRKSKRRRKG